MVPELEKLDIRIIDDSEEATADAEVLIHVLQGIQRAVHIVAMDEENLDPASPSYVPQHIQKNYPVRCLLPKQGSYALPLTIGNPADLTVPENVQKVMTNIGECLNGLAIGNHTPFSSTIRNGRFRIRLLDAFRTMMPKAGATWKLGIRRSASEEILLTDESARHVPTFKEKLRQQEIIAQTITGNLQAMDFEARKITILYPENNRELECFYDEDLEPELWDTRRGLVQVTGTVVVDDEGLPTRIQDVESIQALDLSDFEVREVPCDNKKLRFAKPLLLTPELTESQQYMMLRYEKLDIDVIAPTRETLLDELHEQVAVLWREYAREEDHKLSPAALELKRCLRNAIQEEGDA